MALDERELENILTKWKHRSAVDLAGDLESEIKKRTGSPLYPTGLSTLDSLIWGLHKKELCVIAARPSQGKTSLALQLAWNVAKRGASIVFVTLEMSPQSLLERLFCNEMNIHGWKLRTGQIQTEALRLMNTFKGTLLKNKFEIVDSVGRKIAGIETVLHSMKPDFLFIDHLQLVSGVVRQSKYEVIAEYVTRLKQLSIEYDCGIVACSQINRGGSGAENAFDFMKGAGDIEESADTLLQCKWIGREDSAKDVKEYEISIIKQRHGPTQKTYAHFDAANYRFENKQSV